MNGINYIEKCWLKWGLLNRRETIPSKADEIVFFEIVALKRQGLLGEIVAEHTMEMLGNELTHSRLNFTAEMLSELGKLCFKTSEKFKEAVK